MATPKKAARRPAPKTMRARAKAPASDLARVAKTHPAFADGGHSAAELRKAVALATKTPITPEDTVAGRIALALIRLENADIEAGLEPEEDDDGDDDDGDI